LILLLAFFFKLDIFTFWQTRSQKNVGLIQEAINKKDVEICDSISGSIEETKPAGSNSHSEGIFNGVAASYSAMNESEARAECRKIVQRNIDLQKHLKSEESQ
jgi:hypothetical protein